MRIVRISTGYAQAVYFPSTGLSGYRANFTMLKLKTGRQRHTTDPGHRWLRERLKAIAEEFA
jgi:hypothetical protein